MAAYTTQDIRNIALMGQATSGKTSLLEALLLRAGLIEQAGTVARGNTVSDFDPQEQQYRHSLNSTVVSLDYQGVHFNLIDTPGYPDLTGRAVTVLPAVETAAVVINAQAGIEVVTRRMMEAAAQRSLDRLIVINKIDGEGVDPQAILQQVRESFGPQCLPINLPANRGGEVIDCFFQSSGPATDFSSVEEAHTTLVDQVIELDEQLMELYLEQGEEISPEQLHDPFEQALRQGHLIPVCFVSAETGAGVDQLLDVMVRLMPHPGEGNPPVFLKGEGEAATPVEVSPDPDRHALAHVFRVMIDPFAGRLAVFRVHQGIIRRDSQLFIDNGRKPFKASHLHSLRGKDYIEIEQAVAGDICAVAKVDELQFDSVIHDSHDEDHIQLLPVKLPEPMYGLAVTAKSRADEQKISDALRKLAIEDQSLVVEHNAALNETVIRGQGDLHLRIILEKLRNQYHVEVDTRPPRIAYRETVTAKAQGHHRHKKQTGGAGQFGEVFLRIEPLTRGAGFEFVDQVVGGVIPRQFIPAVEKGVRQALEEGVIAGYPMQDVRVIVYDGKHHPVDSKEVAFVTAGKKAFIKAVNQASPVILEPLVEIDISAPGEAVGDITSDLSARRGRITDTRVGTSGMTTVAAMVPLSELNGYQSRIQSLTGGLGTFSISFSHYEPVPAKIQQELAATYQNSAMEA